MAVRQPPKSEGPASETVSRASFESRGCRRSAARRYRFTAYSGFEVEPKGNAAGHFAVEISRLSKNEGRASIVDRTGVHDDEKPFVGQCIGDRCGGARCRLRRKQ